MPTGSAPDTGKISVTKDEFLRAFRFMLQARILEEKLAGLYRSGQITGGVFVGRGQEALSVAAGVNLRKGDIYAPLIRDQAGRLAFGDTVLDTLRTYLGSQLGSMRGRDGNVHRGRPKEGYLAMISHLGAMISVVTGSLMARRFRGESGMVGVTSLGDGGTSTGSFHEGLNLAAVERLPLVLVVANNHYAYSTPNSRQFACADLADRAAGYGVACHRVDGTDLEDCLTKVGGAIKTARTESRPQLVVASLLRLAGHGEHDDAGYVDAKLKNAACGRDCLEVATRAIMDRGWADADAVETWKAEMVAEIEVLAAKVVREPSPDPTEEDWCAVSEKHMVDRFCGVEEE